MLGGTRGGGSEGPEFGGFSMADANCQLPHVGLIRKAMIIEKGHKLHTEISLSLHGTVSPIVLTSSSHSKQVTLVMGCALPQGSQSRPRHIHGTMQLQGFAISMSAQVRDSYSYYLAYSKHTEFGFQNMSQRYQKPNPRSGVKQNVAHIRSSHLF